MVEHAARVATIGVFLILLGAVLKTAGPVVVPIITAIVLGSVIGPLADWGTRRRVPPLLTAMALVLAVSLALYGAFIMLATPISSWVERAPEISQTLRDKLHVLRVPFARFEALYQTLKGDLTPPGGGPTLKVATDQTCLLEGVLVVATPAITQLFLFFVTLLFFLATRTGLQRRLVIIFGTREARLIALKILKDSERNLAAYVGTVSVINIGIGLLTAAAMWGVGMPNPEMWGLLGFVLNFIPYLGPAVMTGLLLAAGIVAMPNLVAAIVPPAIYISIHGIEGNFITPSIVGRRLTLNPFMLFVSLAFWTWMWGPMGAFLAMPLMIVGMVVVSHVFPKDEIDLPG